MDSLHTLHTGPPADVPVVPGYAVSTLLGFGSHGEVWAATEISSGEPVAIKVGRERGQPTEGRDREVALLSRIQHPHVVRLRQAVRLADGSTALVLENAAGGNLAALVAARTTLEPAEVTTLLVPLAQALQHLHARGLVHGDISPGNVLFAADGRPLLSDLGVSRVLGTPGEQGWGTPGFCDPAAGSGADPRAVDVWQLAAVAWFALTGSPPGRDGTPIRPATVLAVPDLTRLLESCLAPEPRVRPDPAALASAAYEAARPVPIRLLPALTGARTADSGAVDVAGAIRAEAAASAMRTRRIRGPGDTEGPPVGPAGNSVTRTPAGTTDAGRRPRRRIRWPRRTILVAPWVSVAVVLGAVGYGVGSQWLRPTPPRAVAADQRLEAFERELASVVSALSRTRVQAFSSASTAPLSRVDEPGSAAMAADRELVEELRARKWRLEGLTVETAGVRLMHRTAQTASVAVTVRTSAHRRVSADGSIVARVPAGPPQRVTLTLVAPVGAAGASPGPGRRWLVRSIA